MNEIDLQALQITQQAVLKLIEDAKRSISRREPELMTATEVAAMLRMSVWRFYHAYPQLPLNPVRRAGRRLLFHRNDVRQLVEAREVRRGRPPNRVRLVTYNPIANT